VIDVFGRGPGLAAAWVAVKETAENANRFGYRHHGNRLHVSLQRTGCLFAEHARRISLSMRAASVNTIQ